MIAVDAGVLKTPTGILKLVELLFLLIILGLVRDRDNLIVFGSRIDDNYFGWGATVAYTIMSPLLFVCYILGQKQIQKSIFELVINALGFASFFSLGVIALDLYSDYPTSSRSRKAGLSMGCMCLFASICYIADTFFAFKNYKSS